MSKKSKQQGICEFCGASQVTKQHMWPQWTKPLFDATEQSHDSLLINIQSTKDLIFIQPEPKTTRGSTSTRTIRKVCGKCNSGWMSRLEEAARPSLTAMMYSKQLVLDRQQQANIAAWTAMTSMVAEFTDIPNMAIPKIHRESLRVTGMPPDGWTIWATSCEDIGLIPGYHHTGAATATKLPKYEARLKPQTQTTMLGMHTLALLAISTVSDLPQMQTLANNVQGMTQIWPLVHDTVYWPTPFSLSSKEARFFGVNLLQEARSKLLLTGKSGASAEA